MKTVYKYEIKVADEQEIEMPSGAKVIHAGLDPRNILCLWAVVDTENPSEMQTILIVGTGHPMPPDPIIHAGSFLIWNFMWHVFFKPKGEDGNTKQHQ